MQDLIVNYQVGVWHTCRVLFVVLLVMFAVVFGIGLVIGGRSARTDEHDRLEDLLDEIRRTFVHLPRADVVVFDQDAEATSLQERGSAGSVDG